MTELLYQTDAYLKQFTTDITAIEANMVALDRRAFYLTGGGQPHDTATLCAGGAAGRWRQFASRATIPGIRSRVRDCRRWAPKFRARSTGRGATN